MIVVRPLLPRAIIFDWAGTLVDHGSRAPVRAIQTLFERHGVAVTAAQARGPMGLHKRAHIQRILDLPEIASAFRFVHRRQPTIEDTARMYDQFVDIQKKEVAVHAEWIPGVPGVLRALREQGVLVGSCTGYSRDMMGPLMDLANESAVMPDSIVTATDISRGRPAPDMVFEACRRMGVDPMTQWVVKVGDTLEDIREGINAGVHSVGVTDTGNEMGLSHDEFIAAQLNDHITGVGVVANRRRQVAHIMTKMGAHATMRSVVDLPSVLRSLA